MVRWSVGLFAGLALAVSPFAAEAQGTARSLDLDPSPTSAGMGGASGAVFWGDPNHWANPALLAYHDGLRYEHMREQLVPGLATDVFFTTDRYLVGAGGIGVSVAGHSRLDYGTSEGVDQGGNPTGAFDSYEDAHLWGVGVSLATGIDAVSHLAGQRAPKLGRFADVALGYTHKRFKIVLAPTEGTASSTNSDIGLLARVTPFDATWFSASPTLPVRIDVAYGHSVVNREDNPVSFPNEDLAVYPTRAYRDALAFRATLGWPEALAPHTWWTSWFDPLLSLGYADDHDSIRNGGGPEASRITNRGLEVGLAQLVWVRQGHTHDPLGGIDGDTSGWGVGLQTPYGGFRYDRGSVPQARDSGLEDVDRRGFTITLQPLAIARLMREGHPGTAAMRTGAP